MPRLAPRALAADASSPALSRSAGLLQALNLSGLEGRYAMALYKAANGKNVLAKVDSDIKSIKKLSATDKGVHDFFQTPVLNVAQKKSGVRGPPGRAARGEGGGR